MSSVPSSGSDPVAVHHAVLPGKTELHPHCTRSETGTEELEAERDSSASCSAGTEVVTNFKVPEQCECSDPECPGSGRLLKSTGHISKCPCSGCLFGTSQGKPKGAAAAKTTKRLRSGRLREGSKAWLIERAKAKARSKGRCEAGERSVCTARAVHLHHIQLRSRGGSDYADNLLDICNECHDWIHAHPKEATERDWMRHGWGTA